MTRTQTILGDKPHQYSYNRTGKFCRSAVVKTYTLVSGDWFEVGGAYSLHKDEADAGRHYGGIMDWYRENSSPEPVYVSKYTREKIMKSKEKRIFRTWGH